MSFEDKLKCKKYPAIYDCSECHSYYLMEIRKEVENPKMTLKSVKYTIDHNIKKDYIYYVLSRKYPQIYKTSFINPLEIKNKIKNSHFNG